MPIEGRLIADRLRRRMCVECGHESPSFSKPDSGRHVECPVCGADLYERPPRSYAELEGFFDGSDPEPPASATPETNILVEAPPVRPAAHSRRAKRVLTLAVRILIPVAAVAALSAAGALLLTR